MVVALATGGRVSQARVMPASPLNGWHGDTTLAAFPADLVAQCAIWMAGYDSEARVAADLGPAASDQRGLWQALVTAYGHRRFSLEAYPEYGQGLALCRRTLARDWPAVKRIAGALQVEGFLGGADLAALYASSLPASPARTGAAAAPLHHEKATRRLCQ